MERRERRTPEYVIHPKVKENPKAFLDGNGKLIVETSNDIGRKISPPEGRVTTSQVRRIFGDLKRRQYRQFDPNKIQLIRPKLAYTFARHKTLKGLDLLLGTIDFLIDKVKTKEEFENLVNLFESILAYHKKYGGK